MSRRKDDADRLALLGLIQMPGRVFTFSETMAILDIGESSLSALLHNKELRGFRIPDTKHGHWKISEQVIHDYLRKRAEGG